MVIHLHALRYESEKWTFGVPEADWMRGAEKQNSWAKENVNNLVSICGSLEREVFATTSLHRTLWMLVRIERANIPFCVGFTLDT